MNVRIARPASMFFAMLFSIVSVAAANEIDSGDYGEMDLEALLTTVVTASKYEQSSLESPAAVSVIGEDEIRMSGETEIPALLRRVPGIDVTRIAPGRFNVSVRGTAGVESNNLVILIDGRPVNLGVNGEVDWTTLAIGMADIKQIEVVRGPVSVLYGANAYTGVVNILTRSGKAVGTRGMLVAGGSPSDLLASAATQWGREYGRLNASVSMHARKDALSNFVDLAGTIQEPALIMSGGSANLRWKFSDRARMDLAAGAALSQRSAFSPLTPLPAMEKARQQSFNLAYSRDLLFLEHDSLSLGAGFVAYQVDEAPDIYGSGTFGLAETRHEQAHSEFSYALPGLIPRNRFLVGGTLSQTQTEMPIIHPDVSGHRYWNGGGFLTDEIDLKPILVTAGVRQDFAPFAPQGKRSFRGSVSYLWDVAVLRLSGGNAFRAPTLVESVGRIRSRDLGTILLEGNNKLRAPENKSAELSGELAFAKKWNATASLYYNRFSDLIFQDFEPLARKSYANLGDREIVGFETEAAWQPKSDVRLKVSYTFQRFLRAPTVTNTSVGDPAANPMHKAFLTAYGRLLSTDVHLSGTVGYVAERSYQLRAGVPPTILIHQTNAFIPAAIRAGYRFWRDQAEVFGALRTNLAGSMVESPFRGAAESGTAVFIGAEFALLGEPAATAAR